MVAAAFEHVLSGPTAPPLDPLVVPPLLPLDVAPPLLVPPLAVAPLLLAPPLAVAPLLVPPLAVPPLLVPLVAVPPLLDAPLLAVPPVEALLAVPVPPVLALPLELALLPPADPPSVVIAGDDEPEEQPHTSSPHSMVHRDPATPVVRRLGMMTLLPALENVPPMAMGQSCVPKDE
jgi:hypothetical protein